MRAVVQRTLSASVTVDGEVVGATTEPGLLVYLGVTHDDGPADVAWTARKIWELRLLREERSASDVGAPVLVVSQFTLYGDARKGRRPTWAAAAPGPSTSAAVEVAETLGAMGFVDAEIVQYVVEKNGPDLDACVRDLTTLNENEQGLRDLAEMGFPDTKLNAKLLIKNGGSVKNCVRDLVADM